MLDYTTEMKLFFTSILAIFVLNVKGNIFDEVIQMQQIILTVEHNGRHLNVWRETKEAISRFYVTPLCELISTSIKCVEDDMQTKIRHRLMFQVRVWDNTVAEKIQQDLKNILGIDAVATNILPLPMQQFRLSINKDSANAYVEHGWRSNLNQPRIIQLEIFTDSAEFCYKMKEEAIYSVELFLAKTRLVFEFSMMVGQQETRNLNITGSIVSKSSFFAKLKNHIDKEGNVYLTSDDLNDFSRDIFHTAVTYEQITSAYIPSEQEDSLIKEMVNIFKEHRVQAINFTINEWDSVFWDDIFTRPDVMTEYLNEVFTHKEGTDNFKFDELKDGMFSQKIMDKYQEQQKKSSSFKLNLGLSMGGQGTQEPFKLDFGIGNDKTKENGKGGEHGEDTNNSEKYSISKDTLKSVIDKFGSNVHWTGTKFEQKPISLYRVNTRALQSAGQILYNRVVLTKLNSIAAIEIRPEMIWHIPQSTKTPAKDFGRPSILIWPSDLIPIQEQVFSEGLDNEKTAKKIHQILSENYPRDKYFVAVWTRKSENLLEEARLFSKPEIVDSVSLWEHEPIVETEPPPKEVGPPVEENPSSNVEAPPPVEANPPARRKRNVLPKRACLIYRSTMSDYTGAMKIFEESQNKVPKILPNFNATIDVWRVLKPVFNEYFSFMALIQWHTDVHATWYNSGEGMNVNDKYLLFVGFD